MNTLTTTSTLTGIDLAKYTMATPKAHELVPGDVIGVSGDWCLIVSLPEQPPNTPWFEVEVAPIDDPLRARLWQIFPDARMAVLREGGVR